MATVGYRGTRQQAEAEVRRAAADLAGGRAPDVDEAMRRAGEQALAAVREDFLVKSAGGTGKDGVTWDKLTPAYVAYRRANVPRSGTKGRPLLTAAQDRQWRAIFAGSWRRFARQGMPAAEAKANAAAVAWAVLKSRGGKTILSAYGGTKVPVGVVSGRLLASLDANSPEAVVRPSGPGRLAVGTSVPYAGPFHRRRPLWPPPGRPAPGLLGRITGGLAAALGWLLSRRLGGG